MIEIAKSIFDKYGSKAIISVAFACIMIWLIAHLTAAPGGKVSVLYGLVEYTKKQETQSPIAKGTTHIGTKRNIIDNSLPKTSAPSLASSSPVSSNTKIGSSSDPKKDPLFPKIVGNNVEFPAVKLECTTPGFKPGDKFYIALHENGWDPEDGNKLYEMERKGDKLIAKDVLNKRFHPVLVPRIWHKIELAYEQYLPRSGEFKNNIDFTNPNGPCYCFGPNCVPYNQGGQ